MTVPAVSLDGVLQDVRSLQQGMELTRREFMRQDDSLVLKEFLKVNSEVMEKLQADSKTAKVGAGGTAGLGPPIPMWGCPLLTPLCRGGCSGGDVAPAGTWGDMEGMGRLPSSLSQGVSARRRRTSRLWSILGRTPRPAPPPPSSPCSCASSEPTR